MTQATIGFSFLLEREPAATPQLADDYAHFIASESWGGPLRYFTALAVPGQPLVRRPGMVRVKVLRDVVTEAVASPDAFVVDMATKGTTDETTAHCWIGSTR